MLMSTNRTWNASCNGKSRFFLCGRDGRRSFRRFRGERQNLTFALEWYSGLYAWEVDHPIFNKV